MLNHIVIMGRLTKEPELRYTPSQIPVASFTVACERDYAQNGQRETDFIDCVAWRGTGEFVQKNFQKGSKIIVSGRLQSRKWQDRDGNHRINWEVNADNVYFGESKQKSESNGYYQCSAGGSGAGPTIEVPRGTFDGFQDMPAGTGTDNPFVGANAAYKQVGILNDEDGELPF